MTRVNNYQVVYGYSDEDPTFGWIAVSPPASNDVLDEFERAARGEHYGITCRVSSQIIKNEMEVTLKQSARLNEADMHLFADYFVELLQEHEETAAVMFDAVCVPVDGPESIFDQRTAYRKQLDATRQAETVAYC